jgi:hypothetical protein
MKSVSKLGVVVRHTFGVTAQAVLIAAIIAALVIATSVLTHSRPVGAANAFAGGSSGASITFTAPGSLAPAVSVTVGSQYYVHGSGFSPHVMIAVGAFYDTTYWGSGWTDDSGNLVLGPYTAYSSGQILHQAKSLNLKNGKMRLVTSAYLTVNP